MKFTNEEIYNYAENLVDSLDEINKISMPIKIGYCLTKNTNLIFEKAKMIEFERNNIFNKYGTLKEDRYSFEIEEAKKVNEEIKKLIEQEVDIPIEQIELKDIENFEMPNSCIRAISFMIKE